MINLEALGVTDVQMVRGFTSTYTKDDTPTRWLIFKRGGVEVQVAAYADDEKRFMVFIGIGYGILEYMYRELVWDFIVKNTGDSHEHTRTF